jgi:hypothetical protein
VAEKERKTSLPKAASRLYLSHIALCFQPGSKYMLRAGMLGCSVVEHLPNMCELLDFILSTKKKKKKKEEGRKEEKKKYVEHRNFRKHVITENNDMGRCILFSQTNFFRICSFGLVCPFYDFLHKCNSDVVYNLKIASISLT